MMRFYTLVALLFAFSGIAMAQAPSLKGTVLDRADRTPLFGATVSLALKKDSTVKYTVATDRKGIFQLANITAASFILTISSVGYDPIVREVAVTGPVTDLGLVVIQKKAKELADVVIVA